MVDNLSLAGFLMLQAQSVQIKIQLMLIRAILGLLLVLMLLFGAVQYNDPDGLMWMAIYAIPAFWCGLRLFWKPGFRHKPLIAAFWSSIAACIAGVIYFWPVAPQFWMKDVWYNDETAREGLGLIIILCVLLFIRYTLREGDVKATSPEFNTRLSNN